MKYFKFVCFFLYLGTAVLAAEPQDDKTMQMDVVFDEPVAFADPVHENVPMPVQMSQSAVVKKGKDISHEDGGISTGSSISNSTDAPLIASNATAVKNTTMASNITAAGTKTASAIASLSPPPIQVYNWGRQPAAIAPQQLGVIPTAGQIPSLPTSPEQAIAWGNRYPAAIGNWNQNLLQPTGQFRQPTATAVGTTPTELTRATLLGSGANLGVYTPLTYGQSSGLFNIAPNMVRTFPFGSLVAPGLDTPVGGQQQNDDDDVTADDVQDSGSVSDEQQLNDFLDMVDDVMDENSGKRSKRQAEEGGGTAAAGGAPPNAAQPEAPAAPAVVEKPEGGGGDGAEEEGPSIACRRVCKRRRICKRRRSGRRGLRRSCFLSRRRSCRQVCN
ncbi:hypothetical protein BV898_06386 [Hypsibius exemplaris]|uniref:Uncharacterized protein n=1 Tax=Hypsibius exemplaris TaxID=2072580 RepID=A0A1W0WWQ7_HYPEX|nr:hypothetical protein BV898_06386 [Hypsibius exemplaris]